MTKKFRNQKGFTLIEIIAVLVILGILAAVAIPKFLELHDEARKNAMAGAFAAGGNQLVMQFSSAVLIGTATSTSWSYSVTTPLGDFNVTLTGTCNGASTVTVNDAGSPSWVSAYTGSKTRNYVLCYQ